VKIIGKILTIIAAAALLLYGLALVLGALIPAESSAVHSGDSHIYLIDNGSHVELCLPAALCPEDFYRQILSHTPSDLTGIQYLCFGWGDRAFYPGTPTIENLELKMTLTALFTPTPAAIGITWYHNRLIESDSVRPLVLDAGQVDQMYQFIISYARMPDGSLKPIEQDMVAQEYGRILFLEAQGTYSFLYTCNNWTNDVLKAAGAETSLWTPTVWGVGP
jgi:uncharacterized protein (TIGR02117 family)